MSAASPEEFLSGTAGEVTGIRAVSRALAQDAWADAVGLARGLPWRLRRAAARWPARRVLVLAVERDDAPNLLAAAAREIERSHHHARFVSATIGGRGKFENLHTLLGEYPAAGHDWLIVLDDDVVLPAGFLDAFVFLAERFGLRLAQPAHRRRSHAAWSVTRRQAGSVARETAFVEIGPVVGLHASTFETLLPFPRLRFGWGLDLHWSALARRHGWRIGVLDAAPIRHGLRVVAASYGHPEAIAEAREFLAQRPFTPASEANRSLVVHRSWL
jgi:hypothetical protein